MRGRGLKPYQTNKKEEKKVSPPVRGRGLKLDIYDADADFIMSPPVRGRGLKLFHGLPAHDLAVVAPRAGAWIETFYAYIQIWV